MDVSAIATVAGAVASVVAVLLGVRADIARRRQAAADARRRAVENVRDALWSLAEVIQHADVQPRTPDDISAAMQRFERQWQRWEYQVPAETRHLRRSVREAMANCFGAPAVAGLDPRAAGLPADDFDRRWWDIGNSWLEHAQARLQRWLSDDRCGPLEVTPYYLWRCDDDSPHAA